MNEKLGDDVLVTIGLPVYNGEQNLANALDSILAQTYQDFTLIISDNASTDGTKEICEEYQRRDPRIKYHRNDENIGPLSNFNQLLDMAESQLFMWAAHDDSWEPDFIKELVALLRAETSAVLAFCQFDLVDLSSGKRCKGTDLLRFSKPGTAFVRIARFLWAPEEHNKATMIYGIIPTDVLKIVGGIYAGFDGGRWALDNHTLFFLGLRGRFAISDKILFHKGINPVAKPESSFKLATTSGSITNNDINLSHQGYLEHIANSDFNWPEKLALKTLASINNKRLLIKYSSFMRKLAATRSRCGFSLKYPRIYDAILYVLSLGKRGLRSLRHRGESQ